uniref:Uncharacterized protein n=1 Tax=Molossus molossus TaxID=27622 RepID=A0A7J8IZB0_MOLMO|nr:hypothetical protein HJG59_010301 [Molossus molossus]
MTTVEKIHGLRAEWSALVCVHHVCYVVLGWLLDKCKGCDRCLHLSELTLNHLYRNQVSWRTGSWVKERLLRDYFWLLLWMLLLLVCLCMYHNHGDHVFSRLAWVKVINFNIYLGQYGHRSYGLQRSMILR